MSVAAIVRRVFAPRLNPMQQPPLLQSHNVSLTADETVSDPRRITPMPVSAVTSGAGESIPQCGLRSSSVNCFTARANAWKQHLGYPTRIVFSCGSSEAIDCYQLYMQFVDPVYGSVIVRFSDCCWGTCTSSNTRTLMNFNVGCMRLSALMHTFDVYLPPSVLPTPGSAPVDVIRSESVYCVVSPSLGKTTDYPHFNNFGLCLHCHDYARRKIIEAGEFTLRDLGGIARNVAVFNHGVFAPADRAEVWKSFLGYPTSILFRAAAPDIDGCQVFAHFLDPSFGGVTVAFAACSWSERRMSAADVLKHADEKFTRLMALMHVFNVPLPPRLLPRRGEPSLRVMRVSSAPLTTGVAEHAGDVDGDSVGEYEIVDEEPCRCCLEGSYSASPAL